MLYGDSLSLFLGAAVLGLVHGAEPGHGWPIAAAYALDRSNKWVNGLVASSLLGVGHLVSSLAVVAVFFLAKSYFALTQVNQPISVFGLQVGGPVSVVVGVLLVFLGVREYRRGRGHHHGDSRHTHDDHRAHDRDSDHGAHGNRHDRPSTETLDAEGLRGIVWTAFVLGFVHEEEFEIIGLCLGSNRCLELMVAYAAAVLVALVGLTMLFVAGYYRYEQRFEGLARRFPLVSAAVLVAMGVGFALGFL